jgi:NTE family protein
MEHDTERLKIGLALSGGTAKSVAHIGVLKALVEHGIGIDYVAGTSGGALVAAFHAAGKTIAELEALGGGVHWWDIAGLTIPRLGFLSSDKVRNFVIDEIGDVEFDDLAIPTAIVASDLTAGKSRVFTEGNVALACQASSSIPEFYTPVEIDGHILIDGQFSEYVPVAALTSLGEMFAIGVNLGYEKGLKRKPRNPVEIIIQVSSFIAQQNAVASERRADFMIRPDMREFGPLELNRASDIIHRGYTETLRIIPELTAAIAAARGVR